MRGDHIYILKDKLVVTYQHHGIDCGDGYVIHLSEGRKKVVRDTMSRFCSKSKGGVFYIYNHKPGECDVPSVVIQRAMSRLGRDGYNLLTNNCEHFAFWCKTGQTKCKQLEGVVGNAVGTVAAAGVGVIAVPIVGIAAAPAAAIGGGAYAVYKLLTHDEH